LFGDRAVDRRCQEHLFGFGGTDFDARLDDLGGARHLDGFDRGGLIQHLACHVDVLRRRFQFSHISFFTRCRAGRFADVGFLQAGSTQHTVTSGCGNDVAVFIEPIALHLEQVQIDHPAGHGLVLTRNRDFFATCFAIHHAPCHGGVLGWNIHFFGDRSALEHLATDCFVLCWHFDQTQHIVVQVGVVASDHACFQRALAAVCGSGNTKAGAIKGFVVDAHCKTFQWFHIQRDTDPGATTLPLFVGVCNFDAFGHGFKDRFGGHKPFAGRFDFDLLCHGLVSGWDHFEATALSAQNHFFANGFCGQGQRHIGQAFRLDHHLFSDGLERGGDRFCARCGRSIVHSFFTVFVLRRNDPQDFFLGGDQYFFCDGLVRGRDHFESFAFGFHQKSLTDRFVSGWDGLFPLGGGLNNHGLLHGFVGGGDGNLFFDFRGHHDLFSHRFVSRRNDLHAGCFCNFDDAFGFGLELGRNLHRRKAFRMGLCADWRAQGAREGTAEVVVTLQHAGAYQFPSAVKVGVDRHIGRIGDELVDQFGTDAIAVMGSAGSHIT
jgi:hypothetical protein